MSAQRISVDRICCDGHGVCAELLPEMIQLDEWGYPIVSGETVPEHLLGHARRAVSACPTLALKLVVAQRSPSYAAGLAHGRVRGSGS